MEYNVIYYYLSNSIVTYIRDDDDTNTLYTMSYIELNKYHSFRLFDDYENTHEDLIKFKINFTRDVEEIKSKPIKDIRSKKYFKLDYKKYYSHSDAVLFFFKSTISSKDFKQFEQVSKDEFYIYERCLNSGLITLNLDYKNKPTQCYGQDFSRFYPNLLLSLKIPIVCGSKQQLKTVEYGNLEYGIYRMKISYTNQAFTNIFNFSVNNHYHSTTLNYLYKVKDEYGLTFELLQDDEYDYNAYTYEYKNLISGDKIFKNWFKMLETLRTEFPKNKMIKFLMSSLWGTLTSFKKKYIKDEDIENYDITYLDDTDDSEYKIIKNKDEIYHTVKSVNAYNYGLARIKPFLTSFARLYIMKFIHKTKTENHIIRIHTDGIVYNKQFEFDKMNLEYYPTPEDKTTGYINYHNAVYGYHICPHCQKEFPYKTFINHKCN